LIHLAEGAIAPAEAAFGRELDQTSHAIFADEFAMDAWNGRGFARLAASDATGAVEMFRRALERFPRHARSLLGLAEAHRREGRRRASADTLTRAREAIGELRANGRETEAEMAVACGHALEGRAADAIRTLDDLLQKAPPGYAGWTLPVEPFAAALGKEAAFQPVLARLAARAR
jgi:tetratricopeptide (TPR) repeat protein